MIISFCIVFFSKAAWQKWDVVKYMFSGNTFGLCISSNIGSMLSLALIFSCYYVGLSGWGLWTFLSGFLGVLCSYLYLILRVVPATGASKYVPSVYTEVICTSKPGSLFLYIYTFQYLMLVILEFSLLFLIFKQLFANDQFSSMAIVLIVGLLCASYTSLGGFIGVLKTDLFQLLVVIAGTCGVAFIVPVNDLNAWDIVLTKKNWPQTEFLPVLTFFTMVIVLFSSFPDVWVRNFSTVCLSKKKRKAMLFFSCFFLVATVCALTLLGLVHVKYLNGNFSQTYSVGRSVDFYVELFKKYAQTNKTSLARWYVFAPIICIFITTIDTWLVGFMQHFCIIVKNGRQLKYSIWPFILVLIGITIGSTLSSHAVLAFGFFVFPFLYLNPIICELVISPRLRSLGGEKIAILSFCVGCAVNLLMVCKNFENLEVKAPEIIFWPAASMYLTFILLAVIAWSQNHVKKGR